MDLLETDTDLIDLSNSITTLLEGNKAVVPIYSPSEELVQKNAINLANNLILWVAENFEALSEKDKISAMGILLNYSSKKRDVKGSTNVHMHFPGIQKFKS